MSFVGRSSASSTIERRLRERLAKTALTGYAPLMLLLAAALLQAPPESRDPWAGFAAGSWALIVKKNTLDGVTTVTREKHVLVAGDAGRPRHELWTEIDGVLIRTSPDIRHVPGLLPEEPPMKILSTRSEELAIGAAKFPCAVVEYGGEFPDIQAKASITIWRSADFRVPYRELPKDGRDIALLPDVLRADVETTKKDRQTLVSLRIVERDVKLSVGAREVSCVVEEAKGTEHRGAAKADVTLRRWLSEDVPGRVARQELHATFAGKTQTMTEDVVDGEVKR